MHMNTVGYSFVDHSVVSRGRDLILVFIHGQTYSCYLGDQPCFHATNPLHKQCLSFGEVGNGWGRGWIETVWVNVRC